MKDNWIFFEEIDFNNPETKFISLDTRDFHGICFKDKKETHWNDSKTKELSNDFFYTSEELKQTIAQLYKDSGGKCKWRHLMLTGRGESISEGWLKYLRIIKEEKGWIILNRSESKAISKSVFAESGINQEYLSAH